MDPDSSPSDQPPVFNYILSFLLEQLRLLQTELQPAQSTSNDDEPDRNSSDPAADSESDEDQPLPPPPPPPPGASATTPRPAWMHTRPSSSWLKTKIVSVFWTVVNLLRTPAYLIPLVINLTGSVWFFLLVGQHELSLTVPLANSSAFLFTVLGEWYVERKVIAKETWLGMALVLGGVAICVRSKA
ncbi:hypothetical protein ARAM_004898 [Aspergillus rambellii]|uniref:Integral membrane protein n=1 Tax=Aspergillus rambellii TaxID=308745 RepID=A0A0F8X3U9_9EURO|nr:hypothetical protein ARAM_004898 [Aspergillus rambellii]